MPASKSPFPILIPILLAAGISGCSSKEHQDPRNLPDLVRIATVAPARQVDRSFTGVVTARVQSDLGFRVPGKVTKRLVDVGQNVHAGQPLMRIDVTDYVHAITTQTQNVAGAKAKAEQAAADEVRYRGLVSTGAVSASAYDQIKATADAAMAQLAAAEAQAQVVKNQGDYSLLVTDADGTVVETLAEPGQVVAAGQTVIKLAHAGPREAAVYLPETVRPATGVAPRGSNRNPPNRGVIMKITLYGASGMIGSRILDELVSRQHRVTAVARHPEKITRNDVEKRAGDVLDSHNVAETAEGSDAVISAYAPPEDATRLLADATRSLISGLEQIGVRRFLMVGGAGNLEVAPGVPIVDTPHFPPQWISHGLAHKEALSVLKQSDLDWTSFSPAALIQPGERTGTFRLCGSAFVPASDGKSSISAEDFSVALVDELENPRHLRQVLGVVY
jgi:putative NADH-flavin reductase/biotin carboxyl carrier protein